MTRARHFWISRSRAAVLAGAFLLTMLASCAPAEFPGARTTDIPPAARPYARTKGINEGRDAVVRVRLDGDVLQPAAMHSDPLPDVYVGPFELRGETLASALQLILDDYDISLAFETEEAMTKRITIANLRGRLNDVVEKTCSLAGLYCSYDDGLLAVRKTETFIVDLPPIGDEAAFNKIAEGLNVFLKDDATVDATTRVMIYQATQQQQRYVREYFDKLRKSTALIIYETHIWEVALSNENRTGIDWTAGLTGIGNFEFDITAPGAAPAGAAGAIQITPTFNGNKLTSESVLEFISEHGAVKTISQPQVAVLSGGTATLTVQQAENFVSQLTRTPATATTAESVSTTTDTVQTGLSMTITSAWDNSTVYGTLDIKLDELVSIDDFSPDADSTIQLPKTSNRSLQTQIRVRPGDSVLIAGLVTEKDNYDASGPGMKKPLFDTSRKTSAENTELVFLLRPRVVAFVPNDDFSDDGSSVTRAVSSMFDPEHEKATASKSAFDGMPLPLGGISGSALAPAEESNP